MPYKLQQHHLPHSGGIIYLFLGLSVSPNCYFTIRGSKKKKKKKSDRFWTSFLGCWWVDRKLKSIVEKRVPSLWHWRGESPVSGHWRAEVIFSAKIHMAWAEGERGKGKITKNVSVAKRCHIEWIGKTFTKLHDFKRKEGKHCN